MVSSRVNYYFSIIFKIRYIIEQVNGRLMNYKALNDVRNTIVNHIQIDYRNAAALLNYAHRPVNTDGKNAFKVARRLKKITNKRQLNKLDYLLNKHLGTSLIPEIRLTEITDFPQIKKYLMIAKILLGTYQIRICQSYVQDLLENGSAYYLSKKLINQNKNKSNNFKNTKIIGIKLPSRNKRGKVIVNNTSQFRSSNMYKIFIEYVPGVNNHKSIKSLFV